MGSLILFVALSSGGSVVYDHGYSPGYVTGRKELLPWVSIIDRCKVVGTYTTTTVKKEAALILEHRNGYEIVTQDDFRKHAGSLGLSVKKKKLQVFDDSDLSVPFKYER